MNPRDPFTALGLTAGPDLTDEQVRAAWRAIAAATHPDRADGGDPAAHAHARARRCPDRADNRGARRLRCRRVRNGRGRHPQAARLPHAPHGAAGASLKTPIPAFLRALAYAPRARHNARRSRETHRWH